jgi:hypothetical protein
MTHSKSQAQTAQETSLLPAVPEPTEQEQAVIARTRQKLDARPQPPRVSTQRSADGQLCFAASHSDGGGWETHLQGAVGSNSCDFAVESLNSLTKLLGGDLSPDSQVSAVNSMLAVVSGVAPQNEVEGVLAVQIAASHHLAMTLLARVGRAEHIPVLESNGNMALKLLRISREHAEALAKLRRGGSQTVSVEHVHVHSGGQAIVGNVAHPGARGTRNKTDNQPHAPGAENGKT